jgi:hypothetical protein
VAEWVRIDGGWAVSEEIAEASHGRPKSGVKKSGTMCSFSKLARVSAETVNIALGRWRRRCRAGGVLRPEKSPAMRW